MHFWPLAGHLTLWHTFHNTHHHTGVHANVCAAPRSPCKCLCCSSHQYLTHLNAYTATLTSSHTTPHYKHYYINGVHANVCAAPHITTPQTTEGVTNTKHTALVAWCVWPHLSYQGSSPSTSRMRTLPHNKYYYNNLTPTTSTPNH